MGNALGDILVQLGVAIIPAVIAYITARHQAKTSLQTVKEQQAAELERLREQNKSNMESLKEQQNAEIEKVREQYKYEIEKVGIELDKQAELYEKNAQTDVMKDVMARLIAGDMSSLNNMMEAENIFGNGGETRKTFKQHNHPPKKRR